MGRGLYRLLLILATTMQVFGQTWDEPLFLDPGDVYGVTLDPKSSSIVYFDEELPLNTKAVKLNYNGDVTPTLGQFIVPPNGDIYLGGNFVIGEEGYWYLEIAKRQDYEAPHFVGTPNYFVEIIVGSVRAYLNIIIINIDDNRPTIVPEVASCIIQEGHLDDIAIDALDCSYIIYDLDGHMGNITQRITHVIHPNIESTFMFVANPVIPPTDITTNNMRMSLTPLTELDFETTSIYVLTWLVKDTAPEESVLKVMVEVMDIPDTPPRWTSIFAMREFDEKEAQTFNVVAVDGDIIINDDITYAVTFPGQDWSDLISIDYKSGQIDVKPIDRDALKTETYIFTVHACELHMPEECVEQDIIFVVNDLNDNAPTITVVGNDFTLILDEGIASPINREIIVNDIDLGVNAQYTIELTSGTNGVPYHEAFFVAPTSGSQETRVSLFITSPDKLDYEDDDWQNFSFDLVATGIENTTHVHTVTFEVRLNNLNDESPIFVPCNDHPDTSLDECVVEILETFPGLTDLVVMQATDRDIGDWVDHQLLGSYAQRILTIDGDNGQITTADLSRPFDYETLPEIIILVQASDNLIDKYGVRHTAVSQLTIRLIDVNDETPIIIVSPTLAEINENLADGSVILEDYTIEAMDEDTDADLYFDIDWSSSFARKNGEIIGDKFTDYIGCVKIETIPGVGSPVTAKLTIVETVKDHTPDYEIFDTLHLNVVAIDRNQVVGQDRASVTIPIFIIDINQDANKFDHVRK